MKTETLRTLLFAAWVCGATGARALTLDFASIDGGLRFDGRDALDGVGQYGIFPGSPANQFILTGSDGLGDSRDRMGRINGTFTIGPITIDGPRQSAPVTGQGQLVIHDGAGYDFTGTLVFYRIATEGTGGIMNPEGWANLSNLAYGGTVLDFVGLASGGQAAMVMTFQFVLGRSLTQLTLDGAVNTTSFSGNIAIPATVPEPAGLWWMVFVLAAFVAWRSRDGKEKKSR